MRVMIKAAAAAATLLIAAPALAMTPQTEPTHATMVANSFLHFNAAASGPSDLQAQVVGRGLRADGLAEFSGDGSESYGYLLTSEPKKAANGVTERYFEDDLPTYRAPGTTINYATKAAAAPQGK
jgi:hypothetical protein